MSDVNIHKGQDNTLVFHISVQGTGNVVSEQEIDCRFSIFDRDVVYSFPCFVDESSGKWKVVIPDHIMLSPASYNYCIEVIVGEFYFRPLEGSVFVYSKPSVSASQNISVSTVDGEEPVSVEKTSSEDSSDEIEITMEDNDKLKENFEKALSEKTKSIEPNKPKPHNVVKENRVKPKKINKPTDVKASKFSDYFNK